MSDPLSPDHPGDLAELGISEKPTVPFEEIPETPVEAAVEEVKEPAITFAEEETSETVEEEPSLVEAALAADKPTEEAEVTRLRQENARLEGELKGRLGALEEQVRATAAPLAAEPEEQDIYNDPAVHGLLKRMQEDDPEQVLPTFLRIADKRNEERTAKQIQELRDQYEKREQQKQTEELATRYQQGLHQVLANIKAEGGTHAQIVEDFYNRQGESFLYQRMQQNPKIIEAGQDGIRGAIVGIEAQLLQRQQQSQEASVTPSIEASAGSGNASTRGVSLGEKPKQMSEEDKIAEDIMNVTSRTSKLPFL